MARKRGSIAPHVVLQTQGIRETKAKGKNLSQKKHRVERDFRICLRIVNVLFANGLLTGKEVVRVRKRLIDLYNPAIGVLLEKTEWGEKY